MKKTIRDGREVLRCTHPRRAGCKDEEFRVIESLPAVRGPARSLQVGIIVGWLPSSHHRTSSEVGPSRMPLASQATSLCKPLDLDHETRIMPRNSADLVNQQVSLTLARFLWRVVGRGADRP